MARLLIPVDKGGADMTFRDFARACCKQLHDWGYSEETQAQYDRTYMQFLAYVKGENGHDDIRSFNDQVVLAFAESLGHRGIHPNTIIKTLSALSTLARYGMTATKDGKRLVNVDPTKSFRWPTAQRQETKYPSGADMRKLVDAEAPIHKALARDLLVETGIRVGEAARLNVEDLREAQGHYYLAVKLKGRGQQRRKETRDVPLSKALGDSLRNWLLLRPTMTLPDSPLLLNGWGQRWGRSVLSNMITRLAWQAGVPGRISAHKLRHVANIVSRLAGIDAPTRARMYGHSSLRSQERYDHVFPHEMHEARERQLDELRKYIGAPDHVSPESDPTTQNSEAENVNNYEEHW